MMTASSHQTHYDASAVGEAIDDITTALERVMLGVSNLKLHLAPEVQTVDFDPKDPANKFEVGGLEKLTEQGVEICYRLFDAGKTRYAVSELMSISFGAANYRHKAWQKAGGDNRVKTILPME